MPALLKPGGIGQYFENGNWTGRMTEVHASTCRHCRKVTEFPSQKRMMEFVEICRGCMKLICLGCYGKPCVPFEKRAEMIEDAVRLQHKINLSAWRCY